MMKTFVTLTLDDFKNWATGLFQGSDKYVLTYPKRGREAVIKKAIGIYGLELHVYTTVDTDNLSRDSGEDAIRFILFDRNAGLIVHQASKVLRVDGDTTVFERCTERVKELVNMARDMRKKDLFCPKCESHKIQRRKKSDDSVFYGCGLFPQCQNKVPLNKKTVNTFRSVKYPLADDPFAQVEITENPYKIKAPLTVVAPIEVNEVGEVQPLAALPTLPDEHYLSETYYIADELIPTQRFSNLGYGFSHFNRMQSGVVESGIVFKDANFVLGTATSSGKTVAAELAIAAMLEVIADL